MTGCGQRHSSGLERPLSGSRAAARRAAPCRAFASAADYVAPASGWFVRAAAIQLAGTECLFLAKANISPSETSVCFPRKSGHRREPFLLRFMVSRQRLPVFSLVILEIEVPPHFPNCRSVRIAVLSGVQMEALDRGLPPVLCARADEVRSRDDSCVSNDAGQGLPVRRRQALEIQPPPMLRLSPRSALYCPLRRGGLECVLQAISIC